MLRFIEGESENGLLLWLLAKYELHELAEKSWLIHQYVHVMRFQIKSCV